MSDSDDRIEALTTSFNIIREALRPRCPYCGAKLSEYWYYTEKGLKFQFCLICHKEVVKNG